MFEHEAREASLPVAALECQKKRFHAELDCPFSQERRWAISQTVLTFVGTWVGLPGTENDSVHIAPALSEAWKWEPVEFCWNLR